MLGSNPFDNSGNFQGRSVGNRKLRCAGHVQHHRSALGRMKPTNGATGHALRRDRRIEQININSLMQIDPSGKVLHDALMKLPNMTEDVADAIVDWVDPDDTTVRQWRRERLLLRAFPRISMQVWPAR